ncbi:hypothetical protein [Aurantiacibacter sp. D1-12]|uniref:hypothetical protein n=1 Tax=Aurantiacibacter sp. D1-12 TaxID=2993658 RepID=UPI00237C8805|nr:hypothetical protein [Aurantiacibacter sp. D1-12]MDE1468536.1 hypothetical protein [Aurantiacibacter sp. D1-12]
MKKLFAIGAAVAMAVSGTSVAYAAPPGDVPVEGDFHYIAKYYNQSYDLVGYDIHRCDGSIERYREPGQNLIYIEHEMGNCIPFPF